jgi:site-specific DNA-methyltransferase (adenine-specific)
MDAILFSKKSDHWSTPMDLYETLNKEFNFNYDPCPLNADFDGLKTDWHGSIFVNPPYSNIKGFLQKAHDELQKGNAKTVVFLIPSRTDTKWFHEYVYNRADIRFIKGRLKFGNSKNSAPFPSMLVIFKG